MAGNSLHFQRSYDICFAGGEHLVSDYELRHLGAAFQTEDGPNQRIYAVHQIRQTSEKVDKRILCFEVQAWEVLQSGGCDE
jgi:hypothetical protein